MVKDIRGLSIKRFQGRDMVLRLFRGGPLPPLTKDMVVRQRKRITVDGKEYEYAYIGLYLPIEYRGRKVKVIVFPET